LLEVAGVAAHPQESVVQAAALEVSVEFPADTAGQAFALLGQLLNQGEVVLLYRLVK